MFRFNFNNEESIEVDTAEIKERNTFSESKKIEVNTDRYTEIAGWVKSSKVNLFLSNELEIGYLDNKALTDKSDSDLIPRLYEGGYKIWECTQDLADILTSGDENELSEKSVCDLGCSAGILGIISLIKGAKKVTFQDYVSIPLTLK